MRVDLAQYPHNGLDYSISGCSICIPWLWACATTNKMHRHRPACMVKRGISLCEFIYVFSTIVNYKCPLKREIR